MKDQFIGYDKWKLMSPEDEQDEMEAARQREENEIERADVMRDREKDERRQEYELETRMMHGDE
jgi:hypothetical protein